MPPRQPAAASSAPDQLQHQHQPPHALPIHLAAHQASWTSHPPAPPVPFDDSYYHAPAPPAPPAPPSLPSTYINESQSVTAPAAAPPAASTTTTESTRQDVGKNAISKPARKPRKANNASAGRSTLFWVHTDPQSVSEGTREETLKRIRSHVMSEHNRKKRLENTKRHKTKGWKNLAFQPPETTTDPSAAPATITTTAGPALPPPPPPAGRSGKAPSSDHHLPPTGRSRDADPRHALVVNSAAGYPPDVRNHSFGAGAGSYWHTYDPEAVANSPWVYLGQGANDPFNMTHTQLTDRMHRHLHRFLFDLTHMAYPLQRRYARKLQDHWATLVRHDPASLHACICVAASNAALHTGEFPMIDPTKRKTSLLLLDTFHHRGETIRLVNEGLSDPIKASSDELIAAVSILLTIEIASGNPDYLKIHLAGLRQMVGMRNSFADVPSDVRFQISWTDIRVACMAFSKPIFPFVRYARPAHFASIPPVKEMENTASRLIELTKIPGMFGETLSKTIMDLIELVWYAEWIKGSEFQDPDEETEGYFNTEVLYIEYALHSDRYTVSGEAKGDASIEGCVRLACLLFHNTAIWDFYPQIAPVFPKPIIGLRCALESILPTGCFLLCRDLLTWLLFLGACSSRLMPRERAFFVAELAVAVRQQGLQSWQELRALLMNFFYVDRAYLAPLRGLWDELRVMPVQSI